MTKENKYWSPLNIYKKQLTEEQYQELKEETKDHPYWNQCGLKSNNDDTTYDEVRKVSMKSSMYRRCYIKCLDGFTMSVQASDSHYCSPQTRDEDALYNSVEIGYPSRKEKLLMPYIDGNEEDATNTAYGWVPALVVYKVIMKHGGIVGGELPYLNISVEDKRKIMIELYNIKLVSSQAIEMDI